jgi:hypothetical protein
MGARGSAGGAASENLTLVDYAIAEVPAMAGDPSHEAAEGPAVLTDALAVAGQRCQVRRVSVPPPAGDVAEASVRVGRLTAQSASTSAATRPSRCLTETAASREKRASPTETRDACSGRAVSMSLDNGLALAFPGESRRDEAGGASYPQSSAAIARPGTEPASARAGKAGAPSCFWRNARLAKFAG